MWSLRGDPHYERFGRLFGGALGRFLYLRLNFSVRVIMSTPSRTRRASRAASRGPFGSAARAWPHPCARSSRHPVVRRLCAAAKVATSRADPLGHGRPGLPPEGWIASDGLLAQADRLLPTPATSPRRSSERVVSLVGEFLDNDRHPRPSPS
jgi:hypothetical protein